MKIKMLLCLALGCLVACGDPENSPPLASVFSLPGVGDTATIFMLDGKNSSDKESSYFVLKYRWDTNADGVWDTEYSTRSSFTARFGNPGFQKYIMEVADEDGGTATAVDSVFILSSNHDVDTLTDARDGKRYGIVKIGGQWWMSENLRFGTRVAHNSLQINNETAEYILFNDSEDFENYGSLYTWVEANYYPSSVPFRDVCPPGWRIPNKDQWSELFKNYSQPFDVLYYFGPSSIENLGIEMRGYYKYGDPKNPLEGEYFDNRSGTHYWTSEFTGQDTTRYFTGIAFTRDSWSFIQSFNRAEWIFHPTLGYIIGYRSPEACYVRCIKSSSISEPNQ